MSHNSFLLLFSSLAAVAAGATPIKLNVTDWNSPFTSIGCGKVRSGDGNWVWVGGGGKYFSCDMNARSDIATMCVNDDGTPDYSSIYVNIESTSDRTGCFVWQTTGCSMDMRRVKKIEFDIDMTMCGDVWACPLWMSPSPWVGGGNSGEVDFAEGCPVGDLRTNFAGGGTQLSIGSAWGLNGPRHIIMELQDSSDVSKPGTLTTQVCDFNGGSGINCRQNSYYTNFMSTVHATAGKVQSDPFVFLADIWNGHGGDQGWYGCGARNSPGSKCKYVIKNIQVSTNAGTPMFSGHCAPLNADHVGPGPAPPPPPAPTPSGWVQHADKNCFADHGGDPCDGDDPTHPFSISMTVSQCEASCDTKSDCTAIVVPSNGAPQCFRRKNINIAACLDDQGYNLFTKGGAKFAAHHANASVAV